MTRFNDLSGKNLGYLTVLNENKMTSKGRYWKCKCVCLNEVWLHYSNLRNQKSCGCKRINLFKITRFHPNVYETVYDPSGAYVIVELTKGQWCKVDINDWETLKQYRWCALYSKKGRTFYVRSYKPEKGYISMHREVLKIIDSTVKVDHKNHDTLDNRRSNLRIDLYGQNSQNSKKYISNKTGYKGVLYYKNYDRFFVSISKKRKIAYQEYFENSPKGLLAAAHAYDKASLRVHGDWGLLNFPELKGQYLKEMLPIDENKLINDLFS